VAAVSEASTGMNWFDVGLMDLVKYPVKATMRIINIGHVNEIDEV